MFPDACQAGVDDMTIIICFAFDYDRNSSDPRLLLNMCRGLISVCLSTVTF